MNRAFSIDTERALDLLSLKNTLRERRELPCDKRHLKATAHRVLPGGAHSFSPSGTRRGRPLAPPPLGSPGSARRGNEAQEQGRRPRQSSKGPFICR